ncbi:hypothetical protein HK104_004408, partial [Borealophlyctis nickersoniae]
MPAGGRGSTRSNNTRRASYPDVLHDDTLLREAEARIDMSIMHHLTTSSKDERADVSGGGASGGGGGGGGGRSGRRRGKRKSWDRDQAVFYETVLAIRSIVTNKLYKGKGTSLEAYFRDRWGVSRAQVYRFMDCAMVLQQLDGFTQLPCRERFCRALKRLCRTTQDIRRLWASVLECVGSESTTLTSSLIQRVHQRLVNEDEPDFEFDGVSEGGGGEEDEEHRQQTPQTQQRSAVTSPVLSMGETEVAQSAVGGLVRSDGGRNRRASGAAAAAPAPAPAPVSGMSMKGERNLEDSMITRAATEMQGFVNYDQIIAEDSCGEVEQEDDGVVVSVLPAVTAGVAVPNAQQELVTMQSDMRGTASLAMRTEMELLNEEMAARVSPVVSGFDAYATLLNEEGNASNENPERTQEETGCLDVSASTDQAGVCEQLNGAIGPDGVAFFEQLTSESSELTDCGTTVSVGYQEEGFCGQVSTGDLRVPDGGVNASSEYDQAGFCGAFTPPVGNGGGGEVPAPVPQSIPLIEWQRDDRYPTGEQSILAEASRPLPSIVDMHAPFGEIHYTGDYYEPPRAARRDRRASLVLVSPRRRPYPSVATGNSTLSAIKGNRRPSDCSDYTNLSIITNPQFSPPIPDQPVLQYQSLGSATVESPAAMSTYSQA